MKTKLVGLAAITVALVMSVGMASAGGPTGYTAVAGVSVHQGFAYQTIATYGYDYVKLNRVTIGNYFVNSTCLPDPESTVPGIGTAYTKYVHYNDSIKGTGAVKATIGVSFDPTHQYCTKFSALNVTGNKVVVGQHTHLMVGDDLYAQEFVAATEGAVTQPLLEDMSVTTQTCHNRIIEMGVTKSGLMNATDVGQTQNTMVFHKVSVPSVTPAYDLYDYVSGAGAGVTFSWTYVNPGW